ncbi:MAG: AAA family ATPase [Actinomycetia bacterium]|nr:AAA family ATPase [Actinomycetes bacterium]
MAGKKIAVTGKGGVGKSTLAAALALLLSKEGGEVLAFDSDPDANLAQALGISHAEQSKIVPISKQIALIEERTGAKVNRYGQVFKLNPEVHDVADKFAYKRGNISLLVLGAIQAGGSGCACPENVFAQSLTTDLVLFQNQTLIMDMEAGIEHLGRSTVKGVDVVVCVVEPGQRSIDAAITIDRMAREIGLQHVEFVANKVANAGEEDYVREQLPSEPLGIIPYSDTIRAADRDGVSVLDTASPELVAIYQEILDKLEVCA